MNFLFCSVGRRVGLMENFRKSLDENSKIIATDNSPTAPALYFADRQYIVPKITDERYIPLLLDICAREKINAVTTYIDPEIEILAKNREAFSEIGVEVLAPYAETAQLCFDKYEMYRFLLKNNIKTIKTYVDTDSFLKDLKQGKCALPVFVKPRRGSGSVGAMKVESLEELSLARLQENDLIIQEYMDGTDIDADVYVDTISHKAVSIFAKKKLKTTIGGASVTSSFIDDRLFETIERAVDLLMFNGPIDMDFFYKNGEYILSEINPRFGGAYLHAYGCGMDFIKLILNNLEGNENETRFGSYEEDVLMMLFDSVIIEKRDKLENQLIKL